MNKSDTVSLVVLKSGVAMLSQGCIVCKEIGMTADTKLSDSMDGSDLLALSVSLHCAVLEFERIPENDPHHTAYSVAIQRSIGMCLRIIERCYPDAKEIIINNIGSKVADSILGQMFADNVIRKASGK